MAQTGLVIIAETDLIADIAATLALIHQRLAGRHGETFRALERRLDAVARGELDSGFPVHQLEPGRLILAPSAQLLALVADARALGVI